MAGACGSACGCSVSSGILNGAVCDICGVEGDRDGGCGGVAALTCAERALCRGNGGGPNICQCGDAGCAGGWKLLPELPARCMPGGSGGRTLPCALMLLRCGVMPLSCGDKPPGGEAPRLLCAKGCAPLPDALRRPLGAAIAGDGTTCRACPGICGNCAGPTCGAGDCAACAGAGRCCGACTGAAPLGCAADAAAAGGCCVASRTSVMQTLSSLTICAEVGRASGEISRQRRMSCASRAGHARLQSSRCGLLLQRHAQPSSTVVEGVQRELSCANARKRQRDPQGVICAV